MTYEVQDGKTPDTPESLARWIWCKFVGIPITEPYDAMYLQLLERLKFMHRSEFTKGLHEGVQQMKLRVPDENSHIAWCRYTESGTIVTCDSDAPKAFKVYKFIQAEAARVLGERRS